MSEVVLVDVDDTLVRSVGTTRIPMPQALRRVRRLHTEGAELYCWSSGGAADARQAATELGVRRVPAEAKIDHELSQWTMPCG